MSLVFISHSHADNEVAAELRDLLEGAGHRSVFLDFHPEHGIPAGRDWEQDLYRQLRGCRAVIVLCSRSSMASRWCFTEISHARALGKHIFPIRIDDCHLEDILIDRQVIDLTGDKDEAYARLLRGLLAAGLDPADAFDWDGSRPLYPGLLAFQEEDAAIFFGREEEIATGLDLLDRVRRRDDMGLVLVLGASGSGKSSLLRAGLLPRLRRDVDRWLIVDPFRPRVDPLRELATVLSRAFERLGRHRRRERIETALRQTPDRFPTAEPGGENDNAAEGARAVNERLLRALQDIEDGLERPPGPPADRFLRLLKASLENPRSPALLGFGTGVPSTSHDRNPLAATTDDLRLLSGRSEARVLLMVDQFEELLGHPDEHPATQFLALLRSAAEMENSPLLVLATLRSDFLGQFQKYPVLLGLRFDSLSLGPMSPGNVARIIDGPAELAEIELGPGLVQALVDDAGSEDALPLLAFTLRELNERFGNDKRLELSEYRERLGGMHRAVAKAAEDLLRTERVGPMEEECLRRAFLAMVRVTDEGGYARRPARWEDLAPEAHPLLEEFVEARLLVSGIDGDERILEVAHEALFRSWDRLVGWLERGAEALRLERDLDVAARAWDERGRRDDDLWRGARLALARELIGRGDLTPGNTSSAFVEASEQVQQARAKADLRKARRFAAIVSTAFLIALIGGAVAWFQAVKARAESRRAEENLSRAYLQDALRSHAAGRSDQALAYLARAVRLDPNSEVARSWITDLLLRGPRFARARLRHDRPVVSATYSSDGKRILTWSTTAAFVWDARSGERIGEPWRYRTSPYSVLTLSADGETVAATASRYGIVRRTRSDEGLRIDGIDPEAAWKVAVNADGARVAAPTRSDDGILVWETATGREVGRLENALDGNRFFGLSPDGQRLATGAENGGARVWDVATGSPVGPTLQHDDWVTHVAFGPGNLLVTVAWDLAARVWDLETGELVAGPFRHEQRIWSALFSNDGQRVVTASSDGTARIWDVAAGKAVKALRHDDRVTFATFDAAGDRVLTVCGDHAVRSWAADTGRPLSPVLWHPGAVAAAAFDQQGVVTATWDGTLRMWDLTSGVAKESLLDRPSDWHDTSVLRHAAISPDGRHVAMTAWRDTAAWLSRVTPSGTTVTEPLRHEAEVRSISFSKDGRWVLTASEDKTAQIWDAASGKPVGEPLRHGEPVRRASFSDDGRSFLTVAGKEVWIFDTASRMPAGAPVRHDQRVSFATFDPTGRSVLTIAGTEARVVELPSAQAVVLSHEGRARAGAFASNGLSVVTTAEKRVQRWNLRTGRAVGPPLDHEEPVRSVSFDPQDRWIVTVAGHRAYLWDALTGQPAGEPFVHTDSVEFAVFSADGAEVLTASKDGTAAIWRSAYGRPAGDLVADARTLDPGIVLAGRRLWQNACRRWRDPVFAEFLDDEQARRLKGQLRLRSDAALFASFDLRRIVTYERGQEPALRLWDATTGQLIQELRSAGELASLGFSPDSRRLLATTDVNFSRWSLWDTGTGKLIAAEPADGGNVRCWAFSPDSRLFVTTEGPSARVWDAATGRERTEPLRHESLVWPLDLSPDGRSLVTGTQSGTAQLWDVETGARIAKKMHHAEDCNVMSVAFSPDGRRVVTVCEDQGVRLWDATTGDPASSTILWLDGFTAAAFSADGRRILAEDPDRRVWAFDVLLGTPEDAELLATAAEVVVGFRVTDAGTPEPLPDEPAAWSRLQAAAASTRDDHGSAALVRWYLAHPWERTISPLSRSTVEEYLRELLDKGTEEARSLAVQLFPGHPLLAGSSPSPSETVGDMVYE